MLYDFYNTIDNKKLYGKIINIKDKGEIKL